VSYSISAFDSAAKSAGLLRLCACQAAVRRHASASRTSSKTEDLQHADHTGLSGPFSAMMDRRNALLLPGNPELFLGIVLTVLVNFGSDENLTQIVFRAAGADFLI